MGLGRGEGGRGGGCSSLLLRVGGWRKGRGGRGGGGARRGGRGGRGAGGVDGGVGVAFRVVSEWGLKKFQRRYEGTFQSCSRLVFFLDLGVQIHLTSRSSRQGGN